jgi:CHAP domain
MSTKSLAEKLSIKPASRDHLGGKEEAGWVRDHEAGSARLRIRFGLLASLVTAVVLFAIPAAGHSSILVEEGTWLGGQGVAVAAGKDPVCTYATALGLKCQPVDLVKRQYAELGWPLSRSRVGPAENFFEKASGLGLIRHPASDGRPGPGDLVVWAGPGQAPGHVAVVSHLEGNKLVLYEQNWPGSPGRYELDLVDGHLPSWDRGLRILGWSHHPQNQLSGGDQATVPIVSSGPAPLAPAPTIASVSLGSSEQGVLTISGSGFVCAGEREVQIWAGDGDYVGEAAELSCSEGQLLARGGVLIGAEPGTYIVKVQNPDGQLSNAATLTIAPPPMESPAPNVPPEAHLSIFESAHSQETLTFDNGTLNWSVQPSVQTVRLIFNGGRSVDHDERLTSYEWRINGALVSTSAAFFSDLGRGTHQVLLTVQDDRGVRSSVGATVVIT